MIKDFRTLPHTSANENTIPDSVAPAFCIHQNLSSQSGAIESAPALSILTETTRIQNHPRDNQIIVASLKHIKLTLTQNIEMELRPRVFAQINIMANTLKPHHRHATPVYSLLFDVLTLIKDQIDRNPQEDWDQSSAEWDELEKCVYLLCDWEDEVGLAK